MKKYSAILVLMLANLFWLGIGGLGLAYAAAGQSSQGFTPLLAFEPAGVILILVVLGILVLWIVGLWMIFVKAGKPGWASIVPIYNVVVMLELVGRPIWWILLLIIPIPIVQLIVGIIVAIDLAKSFGLEAGFGIGLAFLPFIFYPILGLGSAQYRGPSALGFDYPNRMDYR